MTDRPILFSAPMVRALLAGTKTQTRRVIEPVTGPIQEGDIIVSWPADAPVRKGLTFRPRFAVGDRIWVKETWRTHRSWDDHKPSDVIPCSRIWYEAEDRDNCDQHGKARPSIFMPRWASRLTLTVTDVRVERLQDISEADAKAEGVIWQEPTAEDFEWAKAQEEEYGQPVEIQGVWTVPGAKGFAKADVWGCTAKDAYSYLWMAINGKDSWAENPWVVAVSFDVREGNIDA